MEEAEKHLEMYHLKKNWFRRSKKFCLVLSLSQSGVFFLGSLEELRLSSQSLKCFPFFCAQLFNFIYKRPV